eukprot:TRINITY_DN1747_c0_g1_i1.p1 TRINITY_DN1747_c0_g1~~TRINITY_DN1747_c0_g1_i1.p1  ORF type:complete len:408 (+),score=84.66 TRINITY_DN1747_c0_g1_i1:68-1291(+)
MQCVKLVAVGDGAVGKTCFLMAYTFKAFPQDYVPTVFDNFNAVVNFEGEMINLGLWDTAGQEDFEKLRPISYTASNIFLLFFSIVNPTSFENVKQKWYPEIAHYCPNVPILLIGTQADQRSDPERIKSKKKPISTKIGKKLAKEIHAMGYYECSAKHMTGLKEIFDEAIRTVVNLNHHKRIGKFCWSITCKNKLGLVHKIKCHRCRHLYCTDCIEIWDDGFRGCPECVINEKDARKNNQVPIPGIKKHGKVPKPDNFLLAKRNRSNKGEDSEYLSQPNSARLEVDSDNEDEPQNKGTKVVDGIQIGNLLIDPDLDSEESEKPPNSVSSKNSLSDKVRSVSTGSLKLNSVKSHKPSKTTGDELMKNWQNESPVGSLGKIKSVPVMKTTEKNDKLMKMRVSDESVVVPP